MRTLVLAVLLLSSVDVAFAKRPAAPVSAAARLVGVWAIDPTDAVGIKAFGRCSMEFKPNGQLVYSVPEGKMLLTYRVEGDVLVTDQPSHPREERTRFSFAPDGALLLEMAGDRARFVRQAPPPAPSSPPSSPPSPPR
jgi:hypothetical protein